MVAVNTIAGFATASPSSAAVTLAGFTQQCGALEVLKIVSESGTMFKILGNS
jgi:hypothetical protein